MTDMTGSYIVIFFCARSRSRHYCVHGLSQSGHESRHTHMSRHGGIHRLCVRELAPAILVTWLASCLWHDWHDSWHDWHDWIHHCDMTCLRPWLVTWLAPFSWHNWHDSWHDWHDSSMTSEMTDLMIVTWLTPWLRNDWHDSWHDWHDSSMTSDMIGMHHDTTDSFTFIWNFEVHSLRGKNIGLIWKLISDGVGLLSRLPSVVHRILVRNLAPAIVVHLEWVSHGSCHTYESSWCQTSYTARDLAPAIIVRIESVSHESRHTYGSSWWHTSFLFFVCQILLPPLLCTWSESVMSWVTSHTYESSWRHTSFMCARCARTRACLSLCT